MTTQYSPIEAGRCDLFTSSALIHLVPHPNRYRFVANVDAFAGNSGSGVFDSGQRMVGILVSGATDFWTNPVTGCVAGK